MGNSMRKSFSFGLWYEAKQSMTETTSEDASGQSSERQTSEHSSHGGSISAGIQSLSLNDNSETPSRISNQNGAIDEPAKVKSLTETESSNSQPLPADNDSTSKCRGSDIPQQISTNDVESTIVPKSSAGNNGPSNNCNDGSLPSNETETDSSISSGSDREYWNRIIDAVIPEGDWNGMKVLILNTEEDNDIANDLAQHLRIKFGCRIPCDIYNSLYRIYGGQGLTEVQKWADVLLVIVSTSWVHAVKNVRPTHEIDTETTKYRYLILQRNFLKDNSINFKIIPVMKSGSNKADFKDIVEIDNPYTIDYIKDNFLPIATDIVNVGNMARDIIRNSNQISPSHGQPSNVDAQGETPASN